LQLFQFRVSKGRGPNQRIPTSEALRDRYRNKGPSVMTIHLLNHVITPSVVGISPQAPVGEAVQIMSEQNISCVVAVENGFPVGILTERNVMWAMAHQGRHVATQRVKAFMSAPVVTARASTHAYEAYLQLSRNNIRHLVIIDDAGLAIGVVTQSNLVAAMERDYLSEIKRIEQIMNPDAVITPPSLTARQALQIMAEKSISCLVVGEEDRPVGILTERDIVRLLARDAELDALKLADIMSAPVYTLREDEAAFKAANLMREKKLRRIVVVDAHGRVRGLVTQSDIVRGLESKYIQTLTSILWEKDEQLIQAGKCLKERTSYLETILRSTTDLGIIATDRYLRVVYCNPTAQRYFHVSPQQIIGRDLREIHVGQGVSLARVNRILNGISTHNSYTFEIVRQTDDGELCFQASIYGVPSGEDGLCGYALMVQDITRHRHAEQQLAALNRDLERRVRLRTNDLALKAKELADSNVRLRELDQLKSEFVSLVSHELRTPLTSIIGFVKLLRKDVPRAYDAALSAAGQEKLRRRIGENLSIIESEGERLTRMINDFLDLSKIEAGKIEWKESDVALAEVIARALQVVSPQFADKPDVALVAEIPETLPVLRVDPDRIEQLLVNLLSNAAKFTLRGRVALIASPGADRIQLRVEDTGVGIAEKDILRIFDKFHQVDTPPELGSKPVGTGLGLAICRQIVTHYGGSIWVESTPGHGSVFIVELPCQHGE